jgi:hypothetical protein
LYFVIQDFGMKGFHKFIGGIGVAWLACAPLNYAQPRASDAIVSAPPAPYSAADAAQHLDDFRRLMQIGDFCVKFDLLHRPKPPAAETRFTGIAWSSWSGQGPVWRFRVLAPAAGNSSVPPATWEWLVQNGPTPHIWVLTPGADAAREVPEAEWHQPLFAGTVYTPFDLLMPFLFWKDYDYNGTNRIEGSAVDVYTMKPPAAEQSGGGAVRISIDRKLGNLVVAEQLDAKGAVLRKFDLRDFAKVQGRWMLKTCELLNVAGRDYDRFEVTGAAMNLQIDAEIFNPAHLGTPAPEPPAKAWADL